MTNEIATWESPTDRMVKQRLRHAEGRVVRPKVLAELWDTSTYMTLASCTNWQAYLDQSVN